MKTIEGVINGIDVQATPGLNPRTQAFVVQNNVPHDIQVTTYDLGLQIALSAVSMEGWIVTIGYDEADNNKLISIRGVYNEYLFSHAKQIAKKKDRETEDEKDDFGNLIRVRVLDR
jgi:hypothetical protein